MNKKNGFRFLILGMISIFTLLFVAIFIIFPVSFAMLNVSQNLKEQYNLADAYYVLNSLNSRDKLDEDFIIIIDITECDSRDSLVGYLNIIDSAQPAAIGLDVMFEEPKPDTDSLLKNSLLNIENLVIASKLKYQQVDNEFYPYEVKESFFQEEINIKSGFINLNLKGDSKVCRSFNHTELLGNEHIESLVSGIAEIAMPDDYKKISEKSNVISINYKLKRYHTIHYTALNDKSILDSLKNKVVLVGDINNTADKFVTPVNTELSGIETLAYCLSTIKDGNYLHEMSAWGSWLFAFFAVFIAAFIKYFSDKNEWASLFFPVFQLLMILIGVYIGYKIFIAFNYYVNFMYAVLGIGLVEFSYNLYFKLSALISNLKKQKV